MKKSLIITIATLALSASIFLGWSVGIKFFFNDFLYETPTLKGLTLDEAQEVVGENFKLINMGENFSELKKGEIYSQLPLPTKHIKKSRPIKIWISKGTDLVTIPNVAGLTIKEARAILSKLGFKIERISHTTEGKYNNHVLATTPKIGETISRDKPISLLVNVNKIEKVRMPDVLGYSLRQGEDVLRAEKLVIGSIKRVHRTDFPINTIIDTNITVGRKILAGTVINVTVTTDRGGE